jgi:alkylation response protein AidB-like acyl-CoA dehydrogenase
MNFALDDEQQMIAQTVRRFAERDLRTWGADADRAATPPDRLAATAGELGFFIDAVPASADGMLEGRYSHTNRAVRGFELGRGCAALAALLESNVEPALAVAAWGSESLQRALWASLAAGGVAALAHDSRGRLELSGDKQLVVSGKLGPVPALAGASHLLVVADRAVFVVATEGTKREAVAPSGWRAARWATIELVAQAIPADHVLARGPDAAAVGAKILAWANVSLAARAAGVAAAAMEHAAAYADERVQFGQKIGAFESLVRLRDDAETFTAAARLLALHAAWAFDSDRPDAIELASRARIHAGDCVARATIDAVQIFGGYGFVNDYPVEKLMRDARAFEALHGDERLGRVLAEAQRRGAGTKEAR